MVLLIVVPIVVQNGITNFVNLLDNLMVGRMGTEEMSGVAIVNQLIFVFNLCIFGGFSGAGIFTAQYNGMDDAQGIRNTFRFKILLGIVMTAIALIVFLTAGNSLIKMYLNDSASSGSNERVLAYGNAYLRIMFVGLLPFAFVQAYSSTLRECGETLFPMIAGIVAVTVNLVFNWLLIFGHCGFPRMGVEGAAIATVLSRFVEMALVVCRTHTCRDRYPFARELYSTMKIPSELVRRIVKTGSPLLINEALWSAGMAFLTQCYSMRGLNAVAGFNIANTVINLFNVVLYSMGNTVGIIIGKLLGAGKQEEAVDTDRKLIAFSVMLCCGVSLLLMSVSSVFPAIYNTNDEAKSIAKSIIIVAAVFLPTEAFKNATYFTLRSGGRTWITFAFDSCFVWTVSVPIAFCLSRFTSLSVSALYICVSSGGMIKVFIGYYLVKKRVWLNNIVS